MEGNAALGDRAYYTVSLLRCPTRRIAFDVEYASYITELGKIYRGNVPLACIERLKGRRSNLSPVAGSTSTTHSRKVVSYDVQ